MKGHSLTITKYEDSSKPYNARCICGFQCNAQFRKDAITLYTEHLNKADVEPHCIECEKKKALFPLDKKLFCSKSCAAKFAIDKAYEYKWCKTHKEWFASESFCLDCRSES